VTFACCSGQRFGLRRSLATLRGCAPVVLAAVVATLAGCALHAPSRPGQQARTPPVNETTGRTLVEEWQGRLAQYIDKQGRGDPAVLAQLPAVRSPAVQRPGQIVFGVTDVQASAKERDGYDVFGLLLGRRNSVQGPWYVFVVGALERRDYRAVSIADVRVVALSMKTGAVVWETGFSDTAALERYRKSADPSTALRFPADYDRFSLVDCAPGVCVEEARSGARWALYFSPAVAQGLESAAQ
jgi:hypothetical protein